MTAKQMQRIIDRHRARIGKCEHLSDFCKRAPCAKCVACEVIYELERIGKERVEFEVLWRAAIREKKR